jgi:hypothetical protein
MVAFWSLVNVPVVALKLAEVAPAATLTEAGVVSDERLSETATLAPPVGAALVRVTVQVLEALAPRLLGVQASEETSTEPATRLRLVLAELPL